MVVRIGITRHCTVRDSRADCLFGCVPKCQAFAAACAATLEVPKKLFFCTDSMYAKDLFTGISAAVQNVTLVAVLQSIVAVLRAKNFAQVSCTHVKSHCGHPWNEHADAVAKIVAR